MLSGKGDLAWIVWGRGRLQLLEKNKNNNLYHISKHETVLTKFITLHAFINFWCKQSLYLKIPQWNYVMH